jgi:site-specific DNA recombinase
MQPQSSLAHAIAYLRVSSATQRDDGMGLDVQRERVSEYAASNNLLLIATVEEAAGGGVRDGQEFSWSHRPVLLDLMARAAQGDFTTLLVAKLDRLSRDHATLVVLERRLAKHGVAVVSVAEAFGDDAMGQFMRGQVALVAQLERSMISDRLNGGKALAARKGRHTDGRIAYGYQRGTDAGRLELDTDAAIIVRRIYAEALQGASPARIAASLTHDRVPTPTGGIEWSRVVVTRILRNPLYKGERHSIRHAQPAVVSTRHWNAVNYPRLLHITIDSMKSSKADD